MDELDTIDRSIDIDATPQRVWQLVARPGWWINRGTVEDDVAVERRGDLDVVVHPEHGEFPIRTERLDEPTYAAYRWLSERALAGEADAPTTLVEFFVTERPGGVTLRVVESGFSSLSDEREAWLKAREDNVEGWGTELDAARRWCLAGASA